MTFEIEQAGAVITHGPPPTPPLDPVQIRRLFSNLVGNALKCRGSETPRIEILAEEDGEYRVLSVKDNGSDLAVCKKIAERMEGRIWSESGEGEGATFCFSIPRDLESIRSV